MMDMLTAVARGVAVENGAALAVVPGVAYDLADPVLETMAQALVKQFAGTGYELLSLRRADSTLVAEVDETYADEPLCPAAFNRVVRRLAHELTGQVLEGKLAVLPHIAAQRVLVA